MKCCLCGDSIKEESEIPLCNKKECIKEFVKIFGGFCQAVDEESDMAIIGFYYNNKLIRFDFFEEDFEKAWEEN